MSSSLRWAAQLVTGAAVSAGLCLVTSLSARAAGATRPTVARVIALPSHDRTSLVIELTDPVTRASLRSADGSNATLELGPVGPVVAQDLVPGPGGKDGKEWGKDGSEGRNGEAKEAGLIAGVAVRSYLQLPDTFARVVVRLRTACHQKVRVAGRRVYLDLVPVQPPAPAAVLAATNS